MKVQVPVSDGYEMNEPIASPEDEDGEGEDQAGHAIDGHFDRHRIGLALTSVDWVEIAPCNDQLGSDESMMKYQRATVQHLCRWDNSTAGKNRTTAIQVLNDKVDQFD